MMPNDSIRLDKWLWHARFFKTRARASALCEAGRIRVGGRLVAKAHYALRVGDVLTFPQGRRIRVVRVAALSARRVAAPDAATLYEDLSPDEAEQAA
jgi:ribosome-associated heat shock protein Hsp15